MISRSRIRALFARKSSPVRRRTGRPTLEGLEGRTLLTGFTALSLTDLIADINQSNIAGGTNTITLTAPSTSPYTVTAVDNTTDGATGLPVIAAGNNLSIVGNGDTIQRSTATGTPAFRLFDVAAGATLNLQGLTVQNGLASGSGVQAEGGAIYSQGTLSMDTVSVQNNTALGSDGVNAVVRVVGTGRERLPYAGSGASASGGGLYVAGGAVTLSNDTFSGNNVSGGKGGEVGSAYVYGGDGGSGLGGGICVGAGSVTLSNDALSGNNALGGIGGIGGNGGTASSAAAAGGGGGGGSGGGLYVAGGAVTLSNDTLSGNNAFGALGGIAGGVDPVPGVVGLASGGGLYQAQGTVTLTGDTVSNNSAVACTEGFAFGGGLYLAQGTATLTNDTLSGNSAKGSNVLALGGALYVSAASALVNNSTFSHNTANGGIDLDVQFSPPPGTIYGQTFTGTGGLGGGIFISDEGSGSVTLNNSTVANNSTQAYNSQGGGLFMNGGIATLTNCTVSDNTAGKGGGLGSLLGYSPPSMTLTGCTISGNTAGSNGGGLYNSGGISTLTNCTISDNTASNGGGLNFLEGQETLTNCTISDNTAGSYGGGMFNKGATETLSNCTISGNTAASRGGGLDNLGGIATLTGGTISGNTAGTFGGGLNNEGNATLSNCNISGNTAGGNGGGNGGGVEDSLDGEVTLSNCTISGNSTASATGYNYGDGGGLSIDDAERISSTGSLFQPGARATLTDCTISDNSVSADTGYLVGDGGGLYVDAGETATLINCTVNDNSANDGGGLFINAGLAAVGDGVTGVDSPGTATLINCTVRDNSASGGSGGGLFLNLGGDVPPIGATATLTNCTVSGNSAAFGGGLYLEGVFRPFLGSGEANLNNTIVADQTSGGDVYDVTGVGALSGNNNLIGDGSGGITGTDNLLGTAATPINPLLAPLGNYGGPTQTMALLPGSPAIDAGSTALAVDAMGLRLHTDQRGYQRVVGPHVDIGAYEVTDADRSVVTLSSSSVTYGGTDTVTLQAQDELGNNLTTGGLNVSFALGAGTSGGSLGPVTDNGNGTYMATFTATAAGTPVTITAAINAMAVTTTLPTLTVAPASPTVSVNPVNTTYGTALSISQLSGIASWTVGGNPVNVAGTFTYTSAAGTVLGAGTGQSEAVTFTPTDSTDYTTASTTVIVNVAQAAPAVSVNPVNITYGTALSNNHLSGTSSWTVGGALVTVAGTFTYTSAAGIVFGAGTGQSEAVTFTPTDGTDYTTTSATVTVDVAQATPAVSVNPVNITYGTALSNNQLSGTSSWTVGGALVTVAGTFTYTSAAGIVMGAGTGQSGAVTFTPSDGTDYTTASATVTVNVAQAATTTALSSSLNPTVYGQSFTLTATVAATARLIGPPTGSVTFFAGATPLGSAPLSGGVASLAVTTLTAGSDSITAVYSGDPNFAGSPSTALSQTVEQDGTTTAVVSSANPSVFGQSVTFTATVSATAPGSGTPTGTVVFIDGSTVLGSPTLSGGVATLTTSSLSVSNHKMQVVYSGDRNFTGSFTSALTQTVTKDATTTSVTSSANPSFFGQSVTFTATVAAGAPGSGTPTGTVTFKDGLTTLGKSTLTSGSASVTTASLAVATHSITVSYSGDANFTTSASTTLSQVVDQAATTTSLVSATNPSVYGQAATFTATVSAAAPGSGTPTGKVTFYDGSISLGTASLSSGSASFTTKALPTGADSITAFYGGSGNFTPGTSPVLDQTVNQAATTSAVASSTNPSVYGQSVTFTATVMAVAPGSGTPTGSITFLDGSNALGTATLSGGKATFKTPALAAGPHTITVSYGGDGNFLISASGHLAQTVNQAATTSTVTSSANPSVFGQSVTFTATVKAVAPGSGTPTGTVSFLDGSTTLGTGTLSGGTATFSVSTLAAATHSITVVYGGDADFLTSTSGILTQTVKQAATTSSVSSSLNPSASGQAVIFTATITSVSPGSGTPAGTVTFDDGSTVLGTVTLTNGTACFTTSSLAVGTHSIKIVYAGDTNFKTSTSAVLKQVVNSSSDLVVAVTIAPSLVDQALSALGDEPLTDALVADMTALQPPVTRAKAAPAAVRG